MVIAMVADDAMT